MKPTKRSRQHEIAKRSLETLCILVALVIGVLLILGGIFYALQKSSAAHESGENYTGIVTAPSFF